MSAWPAINLRAISCLAHSDLTRAGLAGRRHFTLANRSDLGIKLGVNLAISVLDGVVRFGILAITLIDVHVLFLLLNGPSVARPPRVLKLAPRWRLAIHRVVIETNTSLTSSEEFGPLALLVHVLLKVARALQLMPHAFVHGTPTC